MPTREEITVGAVDICEKSGLGWNEATYLIDFLFTYLDSVGVVLKVDRELPNHLMEGQVACDKPTYQEMLRRAGFVAVESLIE